MRTVSTATQNTWEGGDYSSDEDRPMVRATIQKIHIVKVDYHQGKDITHTWSHDGKFRSAIWGQEQQPRELRNIKAFTWSRSIDQDVATATLTLYNTRLVLNPGEIPNDEDFDLPGFYTPNRGEDGETFWGTRWGYEANHWLHWLVPDRLVRTFEGYGVDIDVPPQQDEHMYPSGVWLIDDVEFTNDGLITVTMRDVGRLLLEQIAFPPIVPHEVYPLYWEKYATEDDAPGVTPDLGWVRPNYDDNSNERYIGDPDAGPDQEVLGDGLVYGHSGADAFDGGSSANVSYWLSVAAGRDGFAWIQGTFSPEVVQYVRVVMQGGPYRMFVSVMVDGIWKGREKIPYSHEDGTVDVNAAIRYADVFRVEDGENIVKLHTTYETATQVRLTFTRLWDSGIGQHGQRRVAVRDVQVAGTASETPGSGTHPVGNYGDFTSIVKWVAAWCGFYWPREGSGLAFEKYPGSDTKHFSPPAEDDAVLPKGRVWGDFMQSGTQGIAKLTEDAFDKKPMMDAISAVREIVGFNFWIDETGGVIWRLPNVFEKGSYTTPTSGGAHGARTTDVLVISEEQTLMQISAKLSSQNVRERVFVANAGGKFGAVVKGYNPYPSGIMRVGGWTDQGFETEAECERMADMIALRQAFLFRQDQIKIPAHPGVQIDDQVRIFERQTGEGYLHRVTGITSNFDNEEGLWTYDLTTHWLGDEPFTNWAFDPDVLSEVTKSYLRAIGVTGI